MSMNCGMSFAGILAAYAFTLRFLSSVSSTTVWSEVGEGGEEGEVTLWWRLSAE